MRPQRVWFSSQFGLKTSISSGLSMKAGIKSKIEYDLGSSLKLGREFCKFWSVKTGINFGVRSKIGYQFYCQV